MRDINDSRTIQEALAVGNRIAIVGLSPKEDRDSHKVAKYLLHHGYEIVPVRPKADEILGRKVYERLSDIEGEVDVVDLFLNPERVLPVVEEAISIGAKILWMQLGVVNEEAAQMARDAGLHVVMDRCIKIEHERDV